MSNIQHITLLELNRMVLEAVQSALPAAYWVVAEISELKEHRGSCYLTLFQKDDESDFIVAQASAIIWSSSYRMLKPYFESVTGSSLTRGLRVLLSVRVQFHERYGYSLQVVDMEPSFTLGDVEQRRRATIKRLVDDGVADMNRELELPLLPKRIAVVSSATAAGLQDFTNHLNDIGADFCIETTLFAATMQGDGAPASIVAALEAIFNQQHLYDAVVLVRGGGALADMACFDSYELALHVAQFPLPIISGIGHDKDQSVVDMVAHTSVKTPTAAAEFIVGHFAQAQHELRELQHRLVRSLTERLQHEQALLDVRSRAVSSLATSMLQTNAMLLDMRCRQLPVTVRHRMERGQGRLNAQVQRVLVAAKMRMLNATARLDAQPKRVQMSVAALLERNRGKLAQAETIAKHLNPMNLLARGYSITYGNGKAITDPSALRPGDRVLTRMHLGTLESTVDTVQTDG